MLLARQLRRLGLSAESPPDATQWQAFLSAVEQAHAQAEQDRYTLERSLMISSREMQELYDVLRRSEANFRTLVESSPEMVFVFRDSDARLAYVNPTMARTLGYAASELVGRTTFEAFVHPDDHARLREHRARRATPASHELFQIRWRHRDGTVMVVESRSAPISFDGAPGVLVMVRDVTELRQSEERYRTLFDGSPLPIMLFDAETLRILAVNEATVLAYGYSREELLALTLLDIKVPEDEPELRAGMKEPRADVVKIGVKRHRRKDGTIVEMDICAHQVDVGGRRASLCISQDVTETRRLEEQLRQAQKMEAVGLLAGGIAHDFNNILAVILAGSDAALYELPEDDPVREDLQEIAAAAGRAATLTRQLLTFSRKQSWRPRPIALNTLLAQLEKMLCRIIGEDIRMSSVLAAGLWSVEADPGQLEQVVLNLAVNARDAMPGGGRLTVETSNVTLGRVEAARAGVPAGPYVLMSVSDTGHGMDAATRARIFEPFFTTKDVGKGTGLGLSTVFGIVQQCGGAVQVESEPGRGATFLLYFPRAAAQQDAAAPSRHSAAPGGTETILLVEDDPQLRHVAVRLLSARGYHVIESAGAPAALDLLALHDGPLDLVVTDLVMPDMDGQTMARHMLRMRPGTRVLFMSGYAEHAALKGAALGPGDDFLPKPFTARDLLGAVRRALQRAA